MNIFVCLKQVPDTEASLILKEANRISEDNLKWIINPYDEFAIEEALKLKEKINGARVIAISLGPDRIQQALRTALAMGVDQAVQIKVEENPDHNQLAQILSAAIKLTASPDIIFMGRQAIDDDAYLTHIYLAEKLNCGVATGVVGFRYEENRVIVERDVDGGAKEIIELQLPAVVAASKGLNQPRYASMMGIMKAKKIEIRVLTVSDLQTEIPEKQLELVKLSVPAEKAPGRVIAGDDPQAAVSELLRFLKDEVKVL